jgi:hypothetical protein
MSGGESILPETKNQVPHVLGRQLDDGGWTGALLGGDDEGIVEEEVLVRDGVGVELSFVDGCRQHGLEDVFEDDLRDFI